MNRRAFTLVELLAVITILSIILLIAVPIVANIIKNSKNEEITTSKNYIGYYADVDSDGYVDGVIYADLAHSKSGEWNDSDGHIHMMQKQI